MGYELDELKRRPSERSRWTPLTRLLRTGEVTQEVQQRLTTREKLDRWMLQSGRGQVLACIFVASQALVFAFASVHYSLKDSLEGSRRALGFTFVVARAAAVVLHVDVAVILFPVCRTLLSLLRQTPLNGIIPFDGSVALHVATAWSMVLWTAVHVAAHWVNFARLAAAHGLGIRGWVLLNLATGPGWSGWVMLVALGAMAATARERPRRANHERFWYTHHLFAVFFVFWAVHGVFCMIQPDAAPFCAATGPAAIGVFWQYWMYGGFVYLAERVAREVRGRRGTRIVKVIQHPSNVCEIQIAKGRTRARVGQYVFLCCPAVSPWQYHPFTLTSAPEEDYLSVHMRCRGDFTTAVSTLLGCEWGAPGVGGASSSSRVVGDASGLEGGDASLGRVLPRIYIDGPFGSASEDVFKYEVAVLVGGGIGVTPFASVLKSIWFSMNYPRRRTYLRKVYFFWVCRDFGSFEWFQSLLLAIEAQDIDNRIEIHTYLTAKIQPDDATNIMIHGADAERDAITGLRSPTSFGRPNWDLIFRGIRRLHTPCEAGVFFCGPKGLEKALEMYCHKYTEPGFSFIWNKENF